MPIGIGSISLSLSRLKELPSEGIGKIVTFLNKKKEVGQLQCKIKFFLQQKIPNLKESQVSKIQEYDNFNPLISRVLFTEQASKDLLRLENNIKQLEKQSQVLY